MRENDKNKKYPTLNWMRKTNEWSGIIFSFPPPSCTVHLAIIKVSYYQLVHKRTALTFWHWNYFFNFSTPVYKMWIVQEPNMLELWNKLHFEEEKTESIHMFKIFGTYICWINIYNATLEVSGEVRQL